MSIPPTYPPDAAAIRGKPVSATAPTDGQVLAYNSATGYWEPTAANPGDITAVNAGAGLTGGGAAGAVTLAVDQTFAPTWTGLHTHNPSTTPTTAVKLDIAALGGAGTRDSHDLTLVGRSHDGTPHNVDWKQLVDVLANDGTSAYSLQSRVDGAAFAERFFVYSNGSAFAKNTIGFQAGTSVLGDFTAALTADRTWTLPDASGTILLADSTATVSNKTISGASNTLSAIPNGALSNSSVTINTTSPVAGGGALSLGGTLTVSMPAATSGNAGHMTASHAAQLSGLPNSILRAHKDADESVTNSDTIQDDNHLSMSLSASSKYNFHILGFWTTAGATAGVKVALGGTVGVTSLKAQIKIWDDTTNALSAFARVTALESTVGSGLTGSHIFEIDGVIETSTTGTFLLRWAQNAADAVNATTVQRNSYMRAEQM